MTARTKLIAVQVLALLILMTIASYYYLGAGARGYPVGGGSADMRRTTDSAPSVRAGKPPLRGYLSGIAGERARALLGGVGSIVSAKDLARIETRASDVAGRAVTSAKGSTRRSRGYSRSDIAGYRVTGMSKSGDSATVYGYAIMKDGRRVSGSVSLRKTGGKWKVVGYSRG